MPVMKLSSDKIRIFIGGREFLATDVTIGDLDAAVPMAGPGPLPPFGERVRDSTIGDGGLPMGRPKVEPVVRRFIVWHDRPAELGCDGRCDKAWGINGRPRVRLSDDPDDYVYLADSEAIRVDAVPGPGETVGISEGPDCKPSALPLGPEDGHRLNRWCARQCERSGIAEIPETLRVPDLEHPTPNCMYLHLEWPR